ncbi:hypothetical protein [Streptomyces sp. SID486]|uniref:Rv1733c family protein n=1 Tax=Streptomyces sp. SID486 TaxID=2690264 RepID=UPI0019272B8C|nr:hypothetical protein [Streptomyces sp. SID486]
MPLKAFRGPKVWLWRWRRNPLKRRADVVEAWVVLGACLLTVLAGVLAGLTATGSVEHGLARERAERRPTVARVVARAPKTSPGRSGAPATGERAWTKVRWTAPDGSACSGEVRVAAGSRSGTPVTVWTDPRGRLVSQPVTASEAALRATLTGILVGASAAAVPFVGGLAVRFRLERRRMDAWDTEWSRLGPQWGRMV